MALCDVLPGMLALAAEDLDVARIIVQAMTISVVDDLARQKWAPKHLLGHDTMLVPPHQLAVRLALTASTLGGADLLRALARILAAPHGGEDAALRAVALALLAWRRKDSGADDAWPRSAGLPHVRGYHGELGRGFVAGAAVFGSVFASGSGSGCSVTGSPSTATTWPSSM